MYYTDSHTHLNSDELYPKREQCLANFISVWWNWIVNIWVDQLRNIRAIEIAKKSLNIFWKRCIVKAAIGWHPSEVSFGKIHDAYSIDVYIKWLETLLISEIDYIVAIGECGIDTHYPWYNKQVALLQQEFFRKQCLLARAYTLPVVVHSREWFALMEEVLQEFTDLAVYIHCRGYWPEQIQKMIATFPRIRFGFCGNLSYPKATMLRESFLSVVQHERYRNWTVGLVIETDAPRLSPQSRRWHVHAPMYIVDQYSYAADLVWIEHKVFTDRVWVDRHRLYMK
jgi:TatD DNase family protein